MGIETIIGAWKKKNFRPVYWLEGEEEYFIDKIMQYAEHQILTESEASFNLTVFYGKDAEWQEVMNACRRYPMFAEKQVVLLKEAQQMKDIEKLQAYIDHPLPSTIFIVAYKGKTFDKRKSFYKSLNKGAEIFSSAKLYDNQIAGWIKDLVTSMGFSISPAAVSLIEEHIGNDLSRISNEIEKLGINLQRQNITEDDVEQYIGISKEYNIFELLGAIARKDLPHALKILNYFEGNPKAAPIQMALPALYSGIGKVHSLFSSPDFSDAALKPLFPRRENMQQARSMISNYGYPGVEKLILLLNHYNLRAVGVGNAGASGNELLKEMVAKMIVD